MDKSADIDAEWLALESWLERPEWSSGEAAYLLVGLDHELTHGPSSDHGLGAVWLAHSKPTKFGNDAFSLEKNTIMAINRMSRLVNAADPVKVRSPSEWLRWAYDARLEPPWLKSAYGRAELCALLPDLPARKDDTPVRRLTARQVSSMGGKAKADRSTAGKLKQRLEHRIDAWLAEPDGTATAFADGLLDLAQSASADTAKVSPVTHATILKWIRERRKYKPK